MDETIPEKASDAETGFPNTFSARPYKGIVDHQNILALVKARPPQCILEYPGILDLEELLAQPEIQAATRIWEAADGSFAGYSFINHAQTFADLAFEYKPAFSTSSLGDEIIQWAERAYVERFHGLTRELTSNSRDILHERTALLEKHGYAREAVSVVTMERSLNQPILEPQSPAGFVIRPVSGEGESAAWVELHRAGFGTENMTLENRQAMISTASYDPDLDLLAVAQDGRLAAYIFASYNWEEIAVYGQAVGFIDTIATHPDFRQQGLAHALMLETLRRLKQRGMKTVRTNTSSVNQAMQRTAQSVGFRTIDQAWHYSKKLR